MRIKVDEDLPRALAEMLRQAGHDAVTVVEEQLGGAPDERVADAAQAEGRLLITADKGFADVRCHPPGTHPGIILLRPREDGIRPVLGLVRALLRTRPIESLAGCVSVVAPSGLRIRRP